MTGAATCACGPAPCACLIVRPREGTLTRTGEPRRVPYRGRVTSCVPVACDCGATMDVPLYRWKGGSDHRPKRCPKCLAAQPHGGRPKGLACLPPADLTTPHYKFGGHR